MKNNTFAKTVKKTYEKSRQPLAYILVFTAIVFRFIPGTDFSLACLIALCLIILPIIFEIHTSVTSKESPKYFPSFNDASPSIAQSLDAYIKSNHNLSIRVLGISLFHLWPMFDPYLTNIIKGCNPHPLNLEIVLLDPNDNDQKLLNPTSPSTALENIKKIKSFITQHIKEIQEFNWSIGVWTYRYTPHLFGILIGEDLLFVGRSFWENGILRGGSNEIEMFDTHDFHGAQKIDEFIGWFQKCKQQKIEL